MNSKNIFVETAYEIFSKSKLKKVLLILYQWRYSSNFETGRNTGNKMCMKKQWHLKDFFFFVLSNLSNIS